MIYVSSTVHGEQATADQNAGEIRTIVSWSQAKALGLDYYYNGIPCAQGHLALRRTRTRRCLKCRTKVRDPGPMLMSLPRETPQQRAFRRFPVDQHKPRWD